MAIHFISWHGLPPSDCRGGAVAIGNFDGVHRGHAALIVELRRQAQAIGGPTVILTFDPHPLQLLRPEQFMPVLTTLSDRTENLLALGVDHVVVIRADRDLLQLHATQFFEQVIQGRLAAQALVEGSNFGFGRNREGNIETLANLCRQHGLSLTVVPPLLMGNLPVSSSRVRNCLVQGDVRAAAELLGRPYRLRGLVGTGQRRGQSLGFPTANLTGMETVVPGDGVYAVRAHVEGTVWPGAANIGPNPTFARSRPT